MYSVRYEPASEWIPSLAIKLISMIIAFVMLRREIRKRKLLKITFTTIWFKLFSITCIASCFATEMFESLSYVPGFCIFTGYMVSISSVLLYLSMGLYQLYRLYYCFANEKVHSNKGYPKWVFIIMGSWAVICSNYVWISELFVDVGIITLFNSE